MKQNKVNHYHLHSTTTTHIFASNKSFFLCLSNIYCFYYILRCVFNSKLVSDLKLEIKMYKQRNINKKQLQLFCISFAKSEQQRSSNKSRHTKKLWFWLNTLSNKKKENRNTNFQLQFFHLIIFSMKFCICFTGSSSSHKP